MAFSRFILTNIIHWCLFSRLPTVFDHRKNPNIEKLSGTHLPMPFVFVRNIQIYYEIQGRGSRLLYMGGTGGDLRRRPSIFDSPLVDRFEILAYDQRGLGQTDRPHEPYTMVDYAADAHGLLHAVGWEKCSVMGVSFGGMVAQEFALDHAHHVKRLVLACTSSGGGGGNSYPLHELRGLSMREKAARLVPLMDTRCDQKWQRNNPKAFQALVDDMVAGMRMGADEPGRERGAQRQLEARRDHDTYLRLSKLHMPVLICGGRYDGISPEGNLRALKQGIPHAHLELFDGGHRFLWQDKRAFERIAEFLNG